MKRVILLILPLLLMSFAFAQTTHTIGTGTANINMSHLLTDAANSIVGSIYTADELTALGAGSITKIGYDVSQANANTLENQNIYMRHTTSENYRTAYGNETISATYKDDFQPVFTGSITYSSTGWNTIELDTPFEYDGVSSIEIYCEDYSGLNLWGALKFTSTTVTNYNVMFKSVVNIDTNDWVMRTQKGRPNLQLTLTQAATPPAHDIMPGIEALLKDSADQEIATVTITGDDFEGADETTGFAPTPFPNASFIPTVHAAWNLVGTGVATLSFSTSAEWFAYVQGGEWQAIAGPFTNYPITVNLGTKDTDFEFALGAGDNPTLPVELSMFNATYNDQVNQVELIWRTETETQMSGYRIFRSMSNKLADALIISPALINATNSSIAHIYKFMDTDVADGVYYYWLEAVGYTSSEFFGPLPVTIKIDNSPDTPDLPSVTELRYAYPNPFNPSTTICYELKDPSSVRLDIINLKGQIVRTLVNDSQADGVHHIVFDGKDSLGKDLSSGVYLYRLQAGSYQDSRKMILMK